MKNQEKARELALKNYPYNMTIDGEYDMNENNRILFIEGAIKMAEEKDKQLKKYIEDRLNIAKKCYINSCRNIYYHRMIEILNEMLNEFF